MTEVAYKNGYEAGVEKFYDKLKNKLLEKSFYPAIVKATMNEIKEELVGD